MSGNTIGTFAGHDVSAVSLVGLSRVSGWYSGYQDELHLDISGYRFVFHAGVRVYHGSGDYGTTGNLVLTGPIARLDQVPPRILSEVMRKTDLLVTVGERHKRNS